MSKQSEEKNFAGRIITLVIDGKILAENWGVYLTHTDLDTEPELRNKIAAIWISGLLDSLDAQKRVLDKYEEEAKSKNYKNMVIWCQRAREFYGYTKEILAIFTKEEQLFIQDLRDQLVHGWLHKKHNDEFNVKYCDGDSIVVEKISNEEYHALVRDFYFSGLDKTMAGIVKRFCDYELNYWKAISMLTSDGYYDEVAKAIYSDIGVDYKP